MDEEYKKKLKNNKITGPEEFKQFINTLTKQNFEPGLRKNKYILDSHDFCNLKNGCYEANLHVHTNYSDGLTEVEKILNHAEQIAKYNAKYNTPFMLAITDHDTLDSAKETLNILNSKPEKFKHLNLTLGLEISTVANKFHKQKNPVGVHLLVYGINPFDEKLNEFLKKKSRLKLELAKETINKLNLELFDNLGFEFTLLEAALVHEMIAKGFDEVKRPLMKYTCGKILHNFYVKDADFTYEKPIRTFKEIFKSAEPYHKLYKKALEKYIGHELAPIPQEVEEIILKAKSIYEKSHPSMDFMPEAFSSFEETVEFISKLDNGYMCIAHPARTIMRNIEASAEDFFYNMFENFKLHGGDKACFYEGYYGSYEGARTLSLIPAIDYAASKFNLIPTGGLDSHGTDVITRCPYT